MLFYAICLRRMGGISDIFDGDPPHTPGGCISQAWSVAEILRAYFEHVYGFESVGE